LNLDIATLVVSGIVLEIKALTGRFGAFTAGDALTISVNAATKAFL